MSIWPSVGLGVGPSVGSSSPPRQCICSHHKWGHLSHPGYRGAYYTTDGKVVTHKELFSFHAIIFGLCCVRENIWENKAHQNLQDKKSHTYKSFKLETEEFTGI